MIARATSGVNPSIPEIYDIIRSPTVLAIVTVFFCKFFVLKFNAIFDECTAKIQGNIAKAEQTGEGTDETRARHEAQLSIARADTAKTRDNARVETSHIIADARSCAEPDAAQVTISVQCLVESQRQQAIVSLKGEAGAFTTVLAGKVLGTKLENNDAQSSMIDSMADDLNAKE